MRILLIVVALATALAPMYAYANPLQQGGVDHPGEWYSGESLQIGDLFYYELCFVDYRECTDFEIAYWVGGEIQDGSETKWLVSTVVRDGNRILVGEMELGKIDAQPLGGSENLVQYRSAFSSSITWLAAFANANDPKRFSDVSWGKIANIGGEQILPKSIVSEGITIPGGSFAGAEFESRHFDDIVTIGWRTGGANSEVHVADDFPFPIRANTWTHSNTGNPPQEYRFELLGYKANVQENPFDVESSECDPETDLDCGPILGCPSNDTLSTSIKKPTQNFAYQLHVRYGPEFPVQDCPLRMLIKFIDKFHDVELKSNIQYNIFVVDENNVPIRSLAEEEGRPFLYSESGQTLIEFIVREEPDTANYVIWIHGMAPRNVISTDVPDYLKFEVPIAAAEGTPTVPVVVVPGWIKTTVGFWVDGHTSETEFVGAMQFLIQEGIITVAQTGTSVPTDAGVPEWIKSTSGFWVDGMITDAEFVNAIQFLIQEGIIIIAG